MAKRGRPSKYTPELAEEICQAVASSSDGLRILCAQNPHWPDRSNIFIWLRKHPEFRDLYTLAKKEQSEVMIDYLQELLAEDHHYMDENGNERLDVAMLRVKVDAIKWQAGKLNPHVYGDTKKDENQDNDKSILEKIISGELKIKHD